MKNELLHIGPFTIYGYGLMIAIGVISAYFTAEYRAKKQGLDPDRVFGLVVCAVLGGFLGAKLLYFITAGDYKEPLPSSGSFQRFCGVWRNYRRHFLLSGLLPEKGDGVSEIF